MTSDENKNRAVLPVVRRQIALTPLDKASFSHAMASLQGSETREEVLNGKFQSTVFEKKIP